MSRVGKLPIELPEKVSVKVADKTVVVTGPKGEMSREIPAGIEVEIKDGQVSVSTKRSDKKSKSLHGTIRALIANMVKGVLEGWVKKLDLVGIGYRAEMSGDTLVLNVGYSHPVEIKSPKGITISTVKTSVTVEGIDKEVVGQTAAIIRKVRPPEPYKGKGIKYQDEVIKRKPGKAAKVGAGVA